MSGHRVRTGAAAGALILLLTSASPGLTFFFTTRIVDEGAPTEHLTLTDLVGRADDVALVSERVLGGNRSVVLSWSDEGPDAWQHQDVDGSPTSEPEVAICGGTATAVYREGTGDASRVRSHSVPLGSGLQFVREWTGVGAVRKPDVACVANTYLAVAWFQRVGGEWRVRVRPGPDAEPIGLGTGTVSRGLSIAASADRLYVAWFRGSSLKVRRFRIGSGAQHALTSLGTTTVASLRYGRYPEIGAAGSRAFLAFMDRADLKVRRSTDRGVSFGGARTLRDEPFPSEIGAYPTTVAVRGQRVAIGAVEIGGVEELVGRGLGYYSTNGGSSWTRKSTHSGGRTVATLRTPAASYQYVEAWDQSIDDPLIERIRYREDCTGPGCLIPS